MSMAVNGARHRSSIRLCFRYRFILYTALLILFLQFIFYLKFSTLDGMDFESDSNNNKRFNREAVHGGNPHELPETDSNNKNVYSARHKPRPRPEFRKPASSKDKGTKKKNPVHSAHVQSAMNDELNFAKKEENFHANDSKLFSKKNKVSLKKDSEKQTAVNNINTKHKESYRNNNVFTNETRTNKYLPKCAIQNKDAISALSRATTDDCKQRIADVVCQVQDNKLYPKTLPRYCPLKGKASTQIEQDDLFTTDTESPVRIVYVLVVHGRALRQVSRLIKVLNDSRHYFYIHVDVRSDYLHRELSKIAKNLDNVRLTPWRMATIWGGASLLQVLLKCMDDLLNMPEWKWDFFINLSESDFPIKSNDKVVAFLTKYRKYNFLKSHGRDDVRFTKKQGLDRTFYECDAHMWRLGERELPKGIVVDGGSDWIVVNREYCQYLITADNELVIGLKHLYKYTLLPAESFFHTVLENSELCETFVDNNLRVTNWKRKLGCQCQHKHIVDWCGCSPNDFKPDDFNRLKTSRPTFFARKFEAVINQAIINRVEAWMYREYPRGTAGLRTYWQSLYHIEDTVTKVTDTAMTFYQAFVRMAAVHIQWVARANVHTSSCRFKFSSTPTEVSLIKMSDEFKGIIITLETRLESGETETIEGLFTPQLWQKTVNPIGPAGRLITMEVGSEYDAKEQVFRNYGNLLGTLDEPIILMKWGEGEVYTITITWIDPTNQIAASFDTTVDSDCDEMHHKPEFNKPLRPGKWTIKMLYQWMVVAETNFLVIPLAVKYGEPITEHDAESTNSGPPRNSYVDRDFTSMKTIFQLADSESIVELANEKGKKTGEDLHSWVDELVGTFWIMGGFCMDILNSNGAVCKGLTKCRDVHWSTKSPDPKSDLTIPKHQP
ncbi:xylosyltransferase 1-like [Anneissia japonica]|uniref:xylosyltransferase 1-like n=1 Tax=Anneissia japonica TaxID=1529436 RepID=UPI0014258868|nr:xylosyltransferase 1-like [Anneissia japonica]